MSGTAGTGLSVVPVLSFVAPTRTVGAELSQRFLRTQANRGLEPVDLPRLLSSESLHGPEECTIDFGETLAQALQNLTFTSS